MKKNILLLCGLLLIMTACGGGQKPSERSKVWDEDAQTEVELSNSKVLVPFQRTSGELAEVKVSLNGVPFNMWWDTGATMTCISSMEFQKMQKEGKIASDAYYGTLKSQIADGSETYSPIYNINEFYLQGEDGQYLILRNILISVSPNPGAPLLIGQNVIQNLPQHTFDDSRGVIIFDK